LETPRQEKEGGKTTTRRGKMRSRWWWRKGKPQEEGGNDEQEEGDDMTTTIEQSRLQLCSLFFRISFMYLGTTLGNICIICSNLCEVALAAKHFKAVYLR